HHENVDGSGYPLGLTGGEISLGGLIIRIADSYDALIAINRKYKKPFSPEDAIKEIASKVDVMYDRNIAESFFAYIESSTEFDRKILAGTISPVSPVRETVS
ncbi:MAG: HD domain-containing phosphohydrolase, partial [Patescibacteria group bacterium]